MNVTESQLKIYLTETIEKIKDFTFDLGSINENDFKLNDALQKFDKALESNLLLLKNQSVALLFSGGIDSSILAHKMNQLHIKYHAILVARSQSELDYKNAIEASKLLNIDLNVLTLNLEGYEKILPLIMKIINSTDEKQVNISAPFFLIADYMEKHNIKVAVLGQCADEFFCGYQRYVDFLLNDSDNFKTYHLQDIKKSILKNFARDNLIFSSKNIITFYPYLSEEIFKMSLLIPNNILIDLTTVPPEKKHFLRLYAQMLNLSEKIWQKKKVAIQFGSGSYKLLRKIALKNGFTKPFSQEHGYLRHVQLYLDYLAQNQGIRDFNIKLKNQPNLK